MTEDESAPLLRVLHEHQKKEEFSCRFRWHEGSLALWDNRCTQHHVLSDFEGERLVQRVTVMGDDPQPVAPLPRGDPYGSKTATFWRDTAMRRQLSAQRTEPT